MITRRSAQHRSSSETGPETEAKPGHNRSLDAKTRKAVLTVIALLMAGTLLPGAILQAHAAFQRATQRTATGTATPAVRPARPGARPPLRQSLPSRVLSQSVTHADGSITAGQMVTDEPIQRVTSDIMIEELATPSRPRPQKAEKEGPERDKLPSAAGAIEATQWPLPTEKQGAEPVLSSPQTLGTQFDGATGPTETGSFPPDTMGSVGPTQLVVFLNGRLRTFNKTTGIADGVINANPNTFFSSVMTPPLAGEVVFTSDPQVRFDRTSNRWFLCIIDVIVNSISGVTTRVNRVLVAVNDAASNGTISGGTVWTFYQFTGDATLFTDYQSFGVDASAIYIGGNMFTLAGGYNSTKGWVMPKAPLLTASAATVWAFAGLAVGGGAGPFAPRGVDNYDPANTGVTAAGYFIGVDNATFNTLMLRRVTNPGSLAPAPTMSANISFSTTISTQFPVDVPHLGNASIGDGRLDGLDDRLFAAHLRNNRIWTAHNIGVNETGTTSGIVTRNAARWYEIQNVSTTPSVLQAGTLFDNAAAGTDKRSYWIPSIMVSGQGHAALGCSIAGTLERINAFTTGRLVGDTLGTLREGPGTPAGYTSSSTAYNPPGDPGVAPNPIRRWGDYSHTSLDPKDDMTMWTIQEYCNGTNTYGVRAVKLIAPPPPPTNTPNPAAVPMGQASVNITVTGTAPAGQGFYDPGADPASPHTPFSHIAASGAGIIVNSITFNSATQVTLNVSTVGATQGSKTITITNPDGQTTTVSVLVGPTEARVQEFNASGFDTGQVLLQWKTSKEVNNLGYNVYRDVNGKKTKITPQVVAGSALTVGNGVALQAGSAYAWSDQPGTAFNGVKYWLESVDLKGKKELTGPISILASNARGPVAKEHSTLLSKLGMSQAQMALQGSVPASRSLTLAPPNNQDSRQQAMLAAGPAVKIGVKQEGWYRIGKPELVAAGLDGNANPRNLQMYLQGRELPIVVNGDADGRFDPGDSVEFYGVGLQGAESDVRTYWLINGSISGIRLKANKSTGGSAAGNSFPYTVERKDRTIYFTALRNGETENFFGPVIGGSGTDQTLTINKLAAGTGLTATLTVTAQGITASGHQVKVQLNGSDVGTISFQGQESGTGSFQVSQSRLREGDNQIRLISQLGGADLSLVDAVKVTYWRSFTASSNELRLNANGGQEVTIGGFTNGNIRVYDVTDPLLPFEVSGVPTGGKSNFGVKLTVVGIGQRTLMAMTVDKARAVSSAKANVGSNWGQGTGGPADLLVITKRAYFSALSPLVTRRQNQGLTVALIDIDDVYDEFNYGNKSVKAARDFVGYWLATWRQAPRYLLLVGDASYDPKNYLGLGELDQVPTKLLDSLYMEAASDDWMADLNGDGVPELAVGRLPARNAAEAGLLAGRIVSYETVAQSSGIMLASDSQDGIDFAAESGQLRSLLPDGVTVSELVRGTVDDATLKAQLLATLNQGQKLVNYMGHGSVNLWRGNLLTNEDALGLANGQRTALWVLMTCLNGYFDDPALDSLGEAVMRAPGGGGIAVWASSGMCDPSQQALLNREFYRVLFGGESLTIGEAAMRAKPAATDQDVRRTWILLGDPSMRLR